MTSAPSAIKRQSSYNITIHFSKPIVALMLHCVTFLNHMFPSNVRSSLQFATMQAKEEVAHPISEHHAFPIKQRSITFPYSSHPFDINLLHCNF